jgi:carboxyl-terminal processing protease
MTLPRLLTSSDCLVVSSALFVCAFFSGCTTARIPATGLEVPLPDIPLPTVLRGEDDLRGRSWNEAFTILHERLSAEYAYGEHKGVDWANLYAMTSAQVAEAEDAGDKEAWYRALRRYVYAIPDGNLHLDMNDVLRDADVGGGTGLALASIADQTFVISALVEGGPAEDAGIAWGATVLTWDGKPIASALADTDTIWADIPAATPAMKVQQQALWLPRGPVGSTVTLTYRNPGTATVEKATLTRVLDDYESITRSRPLWEPVELIESPIKTAILPGGYRHIRVAAIAPTLSTPFPARSFKSALRQAIAAEAPGLIVDVRGTLGGDGSMVPAMLEALTTQERFFEIPSFWDSRTRSYRAELGESVYIVPEEPVYTGPLVLLVDGYTMGPAETFAAFLGNRDNVHIYGEGGSCASPGVPDAELTLPGGYTVMYPTRRSLDEGGKVQGVSNAEGLGGVEPDTLYSMDLDAARAKFQEGEDPLLNTAVELFDPSRQSPGKAPE